MVVASIALGLRLPALSLLAGFGDRGLDYRSTSDGGPLAELSPDFVSNALGDIFGVPPEVVASAGPAPASASAGEAPATSLVLADGRPDSADNDDFADARTVRSIPFKDTPPQNLSREPGEPSDCGTPTGTAWYRLTLTKDLPLVARTAVGSSPAAIGVYSGDRLGSLRRVGCDSDTGGNPLVPFTALAGTTYFIQLVGAVAGAQPTLVVATRGALTIASRGTAGEIPDLKVYTSEISGDGRWLTFTTAYKLAADNDTTCQSQRRTTDLPFDCTHVYLTDLRTKRTVRISSGPDGRSGNKDSFASSITPDGRLVAYQSFASNLVPGDTNGGVDTFVWDRLTGRTQRVSLSDDDREMTPQFPVSLVGVSAISRDGSHVAFESTAVDGMNPPVEGCVTTTSPTGADCLIVYVRDLKAGTTVIASRNQANEPLRTVVRLGGISADGGLVSFSTPASAVGHDGSGVGDVGSVLLRDLRRGVTELISATPSGESGDKRSDTLQGTDVMSADGRFVTFFGEATDLTVEPDTNDRGDVFVRDRLTRRTLRVSVSSDGAEGTFDGSGAGVPIFFHVSISADGRYVAFPSSLNGLTPDDTNAKVDIFRRDLRFGTTTRLSIRADGGEGVANTSDPSISDDGRFCVFIGSELSADSPKTETLAYLWDARSVLA